LNIVVHAIQEREKEGRKFSEVLQEKTREQASFFDSPKSWSFTLQGSDKYHKIIFGTNESGDIIKKCTEISRISNNITEMYQRCNHKHRDTVIHDFY
jgi:hypothetical protein